MANLVDIAGTARKVSVRGTDVEVYGVSASGIASLMIRFPEIGKILSGVGGLEDGAFAKLAPKALSAFIAAGCGKEGDAPTEEVASKLGAGEQLDLVKEIVRLTFPRGIGPFVKDLEELGVLAQVETVQQPASPAPPKS